MGGNALQNRLLLLLPQVIERHPVSRAQLVMPKCPTVARAPLNCMPSCIGRGGESLFVERDKTTLPHVCGESFPFVRAVEFDLPVEGAREHHRFALTPFGSLFAFRFTSPFSWRFAD